MRLTCAAPCCRQDVTSTVFYQDFGEIMMRAPVIGLEFTRYLPVALVPFVLLQVRLPASELRRDRGAGKAVGKTDRRADCKRVNGTSQYAARNQCAIWAVSSRRE